MLPHSEACERNKQPLAEALADAFPSQGTVLEIASGTGQHVAHFARTFPELVFHPTELDPNLVNAIADRCVGLSNVRRARRLDVRRVPWDEEAVDFIFNANMIHISSVETMEALFAGAVPVVRPGAEGEVIGLYGPFIEPDVSTAPSNVAFDRSLRERDPQWGIRSASEVAAVAAEYGFELSRRVHMPANNLLLLWKRRAAASELRGGVTGAA